VFLIVPIELIWLELHCDGFFSSANSRHRDNPSLQDLLSRPIQCIPGSCQPRLRKWFEKKFGVKSGYSLPSNFKSLDKEYKHLKTIFADTKEMDSRVAAFVRQYEAFDNEAKVQRKYTKLLPPNYFWKHKLAQAPSGLLVDAMALIFNQTGSFRVLRYTKSEV
jgi:hypothetical protein